MIVWVRNAPELDEDPEEEIIEFVDKYVSCELPPETDAELYEIVTHVQMHSKNHTRSCRKTGKTCRFNFPRPPSNNTFICEPVDKEEQITNAKDKLKKLWELIEANSDTTFDEILHLAEITQSEFQDLLAQVTRRNTLHLKRSIHEQWINNYNPHLIRCWNGNMDIQYVLDPYACAMYMLSYITKAEREIGDLLRNAQREARYEGNQDAISQLRKLDTVYLQNREISVMGVIYLICSMPLKNSSRKVMCLQTDVNGQKISLPLSDLQANAGKSEQVWKTTQIEKYINRPSTPKYNSMCMATFFSNHYQVSSKSDNINTNVDEENDDDIDEETDDDTEDETNLESDIKGEKLNKANGHLNVSTSKQPKSRKKTQPPIQLQNCSIKMKERTKGKPAVILYPRVSVAKDSERYHMNMLRLYLPHRRKHIKPARYEKYEDYHLNGYITINGERARIKDIVKENIVDFEPKTDDIDQAWEAYIAGKPQFIYRMIDVHLQWDTRPPTHPWTATLLCYTGRQYVSWL